MTETLSVRTLMPALKKRISKLYAVEGNERFLVDSCVRAIMSAAAPDGGRIRLDAALASDEELEQPFMSYGFGEARALLLDDFDMSVIKDDRLEFLGALASDIPDGLTVVIKRFVDDERFKPSKKLEKLLMKSSDAVSVQASARAGEPPEFYVAQQIKRTGCTAAPGAARAIAERCGGDLSLSFQETAKLAALCGYGEITLAAVDELCVKSAEYGVYDMLGAVERGDKRRAFLLLGEMLDCGTEPLIISAVLNTAFINLYRCRLARDEGRSMQTVSSMFGYKAGDKKLSIAYNGCMRYSVRQLESIIEELAKLNEELKSSRADARITTERRAARIALLAGARP